MFKRLHQSVISGTLLVQITVEVIIRFSRAEDIRVNESYCEDNNRKLAVSSVELSSRLPVHTV